MADSPRGKKKRAERAVSFLVCTRLADTKRLDSALQSIYTQAIEAAAGELVVVLNGNEKRELCGLFGESPFPVTVVDEAQGGLFRARLAGIDKCRGKLVILVDDDNVLDRHYAAEAIRLRCDHPEVGVFGGSCLPTTAVCLPDPVYSRALALRKVNRDVVLEAFHLRDAPSGAGMVVEGGFAKAYVARARGAAWRRRLGRRGELGGAGEDIDLVVSCTREHLRYGLFSKLKLQHDIDPSRLHRRKLLQLVRVNNYGSEWVLLNHGLHRLNHGSPLRKTFGLHLCAILASRAGKHQQALHYSRELGKREAINDYLKGNR